MPLVYQQDINATTKLAVWHIEETEDFFLRTVTLQKEITHWHKRLQHLAGRYLLTRLYPDFPIKLIRIADTKKPFLSGDSFHFSISHCRDYAAVIVSSANRVGIDIEVISQKAEKIKNKFLTEPEQHLFAAISTEENLFLPFSLGWSTKETIFKWYGAGAVDFRKHIRINSIDTDHDRFKMGCCFLKNGIQQMEVAGLLLSDNILTWTISG